MPGHFKGVKEKKKSQISGAKCEGSTYRRDGMGIYTHQTNGLINRRGGGHWAANHR
jgi:hypothetical protein